MPRPVLLLILAGLLPVSAASGQARIDAIIPDHAVMDVHRLGSDRAEPAALAMELLPGDILSSSADSVAVKLSCSAASGAITYFVSGSPFRVVVDVPSDSLCHLNNMLGRTDVLTEVPSKVSAGAVTLGSTGTQYSVEVRRVDTETLLSCIVFDGAVQVMSGRGLRAEAGSKLLWWTGREVVMESNARADLERSAEVYTRFDLAAAESQGVRIQSRRAAYEELKALHLAVLANPADTSRRVALAQRQIQYRATDQAVYNLKRVNVTDEAALRRYNIDPAVLRSSIRGRYDRD
jgi:hypothetical protein